MINRRGFFGAVAAGLVAVAATTRLAKATLPELEKKHASNAEFAAGTLRVGDLVEIGYGGASGVYLITGHVCGVGHSDFTMIRDDGKAYVTARVRT